MWMNVECKNQTLPCGGTPKKYDIQSDIKTLLEKDCEVEKIMKFFKETEMLEEI